MIHQNIADAKANLSRLIDKALMGEEVIIAKDNRPLVRIVPLKTEKKTRVPGSGKKQILEISNDFDTPLEDMKEYM